MTNPAFHDIADDIYASIEHWIDESDLDLDYDNSGSVLTITCENNGSKVILSRQEAVSELWVAAVSGGFHFAQNNGEWRCATGETLAELLQRVLSEQTGQLVELDLKGDDGE